MAMPALPFARRPVRSRILLFFSVSPEELSDLLPPGSTPRLDNGRAVATLCFTRLGASRFLAGARRASDHLALRLAVEREARDGPRPGTWIPWRGTSSRFEARCGARLLRGAFSHAEFEMREDPFGVELTVRTEDSEVLHLRAGATQPTGGGLFPAAADLERFLSEQGPIDPFDPFAAEADRLEPQHGFAPEPLCVFEIRADALVLGREALCFDSAWRLTSTSSAPLARSRVQRGLVTPGGAAEGLPTCLS